MLLEVEHGRHGGGTEHHEEWTGDPRDVLQQNQRGDHRDPEQQRREDDVADSPRDIEGPLECVAVLRGDPVMFGSCETIIVTATPARYPISTGLERRSARNPSRANHPTSARTATASANAAAAVAGDRSCARVSVATAEPTSSAEALSGPTDRTRLLPRNA